ncbi:hypothetical protein C6P45_004230 [Maudiozyma exigua]|uniref:Uncharacterized protein n=1 Tax=Maudiozyma exigua TaxID=34358 RepID=A0A9P7BBX3_MAUEX|nr:hypothetical protein C6P45_004230 [Kazachstania exigua]
MSTISFNIVDKVQPLPQNNNNKNNTKNISSRSKFIQKNNKIKKVSKKDRKNVNSPENYDNNETEDDEEDITENNEDNNQEDDNDDDGEEEDDDEEETQTTKAAARTEAITDMLSLLNEIITLSTDIYKTSNEDLAETKGKEKEHNKTNKDESLDNIKTEETDFKPFNSRLGERKLRNSEDTMKSKITKKSNIDYLLQSTSDKKESEDKNGDDIIDSDNSITLEEIEKAMPINSKDREQVYRNINDLVEKNERVLGRKTGKERRKSKDK